MLTQSIIHSIAINSEIKEFLILKELFPYLSIRRYFYTYRKYPKYLYHCLNFSFYNNILVFKYLHETFKLKLDLKYLEISVEDNNIELVKYLLYHKLKPTYELMKIAVNNYSYEMTRILVSHMHN